MNITINCKGKFITDFHKLFRENGLTLDVIQLFRDIIYSYYKQYGRDFPFRKKITPYYVLISEIMLQQTQTTTVSKKFLNFIKIFSDFESLAKAPLKELLKAWQGLGYNRRALALKKIAQTIVHKYNGKLPDKIGILEGFPQIGKATASSIVTFAFNKPEIFIETNIRRVYIYFFFPQRNNIADKEILPIVEKTIDLSSPRKWYYALMDYGVMLKKYYPELNKRSAHYRKQAIFKDSNREVRGKILKLLIKNTIITESALSAKINVDSKRLNKILHQLAKEGFIKKRGDKIFIPKKS